MSETPNCNLHLTDDDTERFQDWRMAINGPENSNMTKIDNAIGGKADKSVSVEAVLLSTGWEGSDRPYIQTLQVDGLTQNKNGVASVSHIATPKQREAARNAILSITKQIDGEIIIVADGELPDLDIPIVIILLG